MPCNPEKVGVGDVGGGVDVFVISGCVVAGGVDAGGDDGGDCK